MDKNNIVASLFSEKLIKRSVDEFIAKKINAEDLFFLQSLGIPNTEDFLFDSKIEYISEIDKIKIGTIVNNEYIIYDYSNRNVSVNDSNTFLASSIKNFVYQITEMEIFWGNTFKFHQLGDTLTNRKVYSKHLEDKLREIDTFLFEKDVSYYWGSLIESIEFGIIG